MPQQQVMPAYSGIMQPTNMMTGPLTQIMGLPPMGGLSPNMPFPGMMSEQQAMQMTRGIMLPGGMMVGMSPGTMMAGALTQQMGMLPPMPGPMGMQQANMAAQSTGMGMPPAGIGQPAQGQQQTIEHDAAGGHGDATGPGMTQPGIVQPGRVASMPAQMGPGPSQPMPPPPPRPMTQPPMAGLSLGHRTHARGILDAGTVQQHA